MAENKYAIVRTDALKATYDGNIKSGRFYSSGVEAAVENGNIVKLDSLVAGERELWKVVAPGAVKTGNVFLVASPELIYDETLRSTGALKNFRNEAGRNITLLGLEVGDMFSVSDEAIAAVGQEPVVGNYVTPHATLTKFQEAESISAGTNDVCYGKIVARELFSNGVYVNVIHMEKVR